MPRITLAQAGPLIAKREVFDAGNLYSRSFYGSLNGSGHLGAGRNSILHPGCGMLYVVYYYSTPIGWIDDLGRAVIPPEKHSVSTSRHQGIVSRYLKDDPCATKKLAAKRATRDKAEAKIISDFFDRMAKEQREARNAEARYRRMLKREALEAERQREREVAEAIASITFGPASESGPILLGVEGEEDAMLSIARDAYTRDAKIPRVITRT